MIVTAVLSRRFLLPVVGNVCRLSGCAFLRAKTARNNRAYATGSWLVEKLNITRKPSAKKQKDLKPRDKMGQIFQYHLKKPDEDEFQLILDNFLAGDKLRRGHVAFVSTALTYMEKYGVEKNLSMYNQLLNIFPRDIFDNKSFLDSLWPKTFPQIYTALDLLTQMEENNVWPDAETYKIAYEIFGLKSLPLDKVIRMKVWFEFSKTLNPYSLPSEVYENRYLLANAALERMSGGNTEDVVTIKGDAENVDEFSVCVQNDEQRAIIQSLPNTTQLYVDGPTVVWLFRTKMEYFTLKVPANQLLKDLQSGPMAASDKETTAVDDVVLAMFMCDKPSRTALGDCINALQKNNPKLQEFAIVMTHELTAEENENVERCQEQN